MAISKRRQATHEPDLTALTDFQLLNEFIAKVGPESSGLKSVAWEIMRRYTAHLEACTKPEPKDYSATLGDARWGDAKRVERIFGIKRGVLLGLVEKGRVVTSSLDCGGFADNSRAAVRAKRLFCLTSIAACVEAGGADTAP